MVRKYHSYPGKEYWQAVKCILRYLKGTKDIKLCFRIGDIELIGYSDSDFGSDVDDKKIYK